MDFSFTSDQDELRGLTNRLLSDKAGPEHLTAVRESDTGVDLALWREMAELGLVGIGLPESVGGGGLGFTEAAIVLEEVGRFVAPVPALPVMAMVGPLLAEHGTAEQWAGLASGERVVTVALHEMVGDVMEPALTADGGRLTGVKVCAPFGHVADAFVVSAADGLYYVPADADGVTVTRQDTVDDIPDAMVELAGAPGQKLTGPEGLRSLVERGLAGQCVMMAGITAQAIELTSAYVKERVQFDRVIATFQAVAQRAADARIDSEAIWLTAWQAVALIDEGEPAAEQVASAKYWAAEGGQRVVHAAVHLHGGVGVDRDYPLHRYYLWTKYHELFLGGTTPSLLRLGRLLADTPV
ncbi:MAG: acyl-CoA/acyl-ACP dehydrogenase [Acidimicrobiales bacterium]|jgi:alkylation response protein AidB-like acyl-CoA dehydrogenase|nr:acyl-CoA/acyl-ACP dehydrogenase [Acidimicrobiales bacterium]